MTLYLVLLYVLNWYFHMSVTQEGAAHVRSSCLRERSLTYGLMHQD